MTNELQKALETLRDGGLILYPTDTLWGIGCDATNPVAVEKIVALKQRADSKSLVLLASDMGMVSRYVKQIPDMAYTLTEVADAPLTLVYPQAQGLAANVVAEDGSVAIRIVQHEFCRQLLQKFRKPVVSTSANISGQRAPVSFAEIQEMIKEKCDYIVPEKHEGTPTRQPSAIIKIGLHAEVEVIRQ